MKTVRCPDRMTLEKLLLGRLSDAEQETISAHLQNCSTCATMADTMVRRDEVTEALRAQKVLRGDEEILSTVDENGKKLACQFQSVLPDQTLIQTTISPSNPIANFVDNGFGFLSPAQQPDEIGRLGDYRILQVLGMGGMGVVFRAEDTKLKRQVALKVMKPSVAATRSAKDRFLREAQCTAAIEHDNIVSIFQVAEAQGVPFIAMPFLRGESLAKRLLRDGKLSQLDVVKIGAQIASGLTAAHERNLIHRDIKPDNIWLEEKTGRVKILDFGLVRPATDDAGLTQSGSVLGTPRYMAPEQAMGQDVDHRCDLFSLGSVLYQLASGKLPFEGSNITATLMAVVQQSPKPVQEIINDLHPNLCLLIQKLMAKDRTKRPQTAQEVAKYLIALHQKLKQTPPKDIQTRSSSGQLQVAAVGATQPQVNSSTCVDPVEQLPPNSTEPSSSSSLLEQPSSTPFASRNPTTKSQQPPRKPPLKKLLAAFGGGCILLAMLGVIVITIRNKDGKETTIRVPSGTEIDIHAQPGSNVTIREEGIANPAIAMSQANESGNTANTASAPENSNSKSQTPNLNSESPNDPDRILAEWVLSLSEPRSLTIEGRAGHVNSKEELPAGPFRVNGLRLGPYEFTDADFERIGAAKGISNLELWARDWQFSNVTDRGLKALAMGGFARSGEQLIITGDLTKITDEGFLAFNSCRYLINFRLYSSSLTDKALAGIQLPRATEFRFQMEHKPTQYTGAAFENIAKRMPKLTIADLSCFDFRSGGIADLRSVEQLQLLSLTFCDLSDGELSEISNFEKLEFLQIRTASVDVTDEGFRSLGKLTRLKALWVRSPEFGNAAMLAISSLPDLNIFETDSPWVNDEGLAKIDHLQSLENLNLGGTQVSNESLVLIAKLPQLKWLTLKNCPNITDAGLPSLAGLSSLKQLFVTENRNISEPAVRKLQAALPNCKIFSDVPILQ